MSDDIFPRGNPAIPTAPAGYNEIRTDRSGALDEVCLEGADVHLEQMGPRQWWLQLTKGGKRMVVWFDVERGRLVAHIGDDELGLPRVVTDSF